MHFDRTIAILEHLFLVRGDDERLVESDGLLQTTEHGWLRRTFEYLHFWKRTRQQRHRFQPGTRPRPHQRIAHGVGKIEMAAQFIAKLDSTKRGDAFGYRKYGENSEIEQR